jgi:ATP-dependent Clp protease, protease subunit
MPNIRAAAKNGRAEIYIYEDIGGDMFGAGVTAKDVAEGLKTMGNVTDVDVYINSYGGSVFQGLAIYNVLHRHPARITAHVDGIAASAASVVAMAGDTIRMAENSFIMIHDAWGLVAGNAADLRRAADEIEMTSNAIASIYAARSGGDIKAIREWMAAETWFTAQTALAAGFADEIADDKAIAAYVPPGERFAFRRLPEVITAQATAPATEEAAPPSVVTFPNLDKRAAARAQLALLAKEIRQHPAAG